VTKLETLQEGQKRLLDALRDSLASIIGQDHDLRITWVSSAAFNREPMDLIGRSDEDLFDPAGAALLRKLKQDVLVQGRPAMHRVDLAVNGQRKAYDVYIDLRRGAASGPGGITSLFIDVTRFS
jgi:hypothetical protein